MAKFQGVIGTQVAVTGNTTLIIDDRLMQSSTRAMWDKACFAVSVTHFVAGSFSVDIMGDLSGVGIPIAG